jgi:hypothetical protein
MVPVRVPPSVPVPVLRERLTPVLLTTLLGTPAAVCDCTTTGKPTPAVGLAPELTEVITSLVGRAALYVTMAAAQSRLELNVPVAEYAPVALTILYSGLMVMLAAAVPPLVPARPAVV